MLFWGWGMRVMIRDDIRDEKKNPVERRTSWKHIWQHEEPAFLTLFVIIIIIASGVTSTSPFFGDNQTRPQSDLKAL